MSFVDDINTLVKDLEGVTTKVITDSTLRQIGKETVRDIRTRTRFSEVVAKFGGDVSPIAPLKPSTIRARSDDSDYLSSDTKPSTSNLTRSGNMLSAVSFSYNKNSVTIYIKGKFNAEIASYHMSGTPNMVKRPFFNLSKFQISRIENLTLAALDDYFRKTFL